MSVAELIEALDQQYGNPNCPAQYKLIQQGIAELRRLHEESQK